MRLDGKKDLNQLELNQISLNLGSNFEVFLNDLRWSFRKFSDELGVGIPENYIDLMIQDKIDLTQIAVRERFGSAYVIPPEFLREILESTRSRDVDNVLMSADSKIMNYILRELVHVPGSHFPESRELAKKSIAAFQAKHYEASQALATVVLDSLASQVIGKKIVSKIKYDSPEPILEELQSFAPLYRHSVLAPISAAFGFKANPSKFSRNQTVHNASQTALNQLNAIKSITLVCSLYFLSYFYPDMFKDK